MRIPKEIISEIKNKAPIQDIIGNFIQVIKKGNNYVAYCPFHDDNNPSLHISVDKQIFKCFSCPPENKSSGDVFSFVMKYKHLSYVEAVKLVADMVGYQYDFGDTKIDTFEETITHKIMREAVNYCQYELNSKEGLLYKEYLNKRNIDNTIIERFQIGYNPKEDKLYSFLSKKGYKDNDIIAASLARLTNNGVRDVFFNRIMIPISDVNGNPIGFTARSIDPKVDIKYINSTDTPIFRKSNVVFNLHRAKEKIRETKFVILAEGPMDVIAFDKIGFQNTVCSMGTNTTKNQLLAIKRFTNNILLAFDGDNAGQSAILKTGKDCLQEGFDVLVLNNDTKYDPDEIINKYGTKRLSEMILKPKTWVEFIIEHYKLSYDLDNYTAKREYTFKVLEEIKKVKNNFDKQSYINKLAELTGFNVAQLASGIIGNETKKETQRISRPTSSLQSGIEIAQKIILKQLLFSANNINIYKNQLGYLPNKQFDDIAKSIINFYDQNQYIKLGELLAEIDDSQLISLLCEIESDKTHCEDEDEILLLDSIDKVKEYEIELQLEKLQARMDNYSDENMQMKVATEVVELQRRLNELRKNRR
ncbi:MAG: DNA primase [Erysipelotrichia bacterium]|nr:DNA primase [Erysipelotrichia bacterium]